MNRVARTIGLLAALAAMAPAIGAHAAGDLTKQEPVEIKVQLGSPADEQRFFPASIELETGKLYRMVLTNPSPQKHYFSSDALAQAVFTRKVQVNDAQGNPVAEVKGMVREIEVYPKGIAEWWFVPVKAGRFGDLKCTVEGHAEKGMLGEITVK